eukprot:gnl/TRDRNA2_/TRDRNA2_173474_c0_seq2.p1 gnl/TRDRNA2_/TRDRNA2_173474_c0~~gnl/TRDRNA2_/TRDRNA2_173474_c0_seq2.p1  ORF type:complete len:170 (-),score=55.13 gnl/TRDRNA2_/TRDRNA2_173474_c0_seq2:358-813(-)
MAVAETEARWLAKTLPAKEEDENYRQKKEAMAHEEAQLSEVEAKQTFQAKEEDEVHKELALRHVPFVQPNQSYGDKNAFTAENTMISELTQEILIEMKPNVPGEANETDKEPDREKKGDMGFEEATVAERNVKEAPLGPRPVAISEDVAAV